MRLFGAALMGLVVFGITACAGGSDAVDQEAGGEYRFIPGDGSGEIIAAEDRLAAPRLSGEFLDGSEFDSSSLSGKVVVLNFWGSWCGPCRVETPEFQQVYENTKDQGVEFIGVDVKDSRELAQAFLDEKNITYQSLYDRNGRIAMRFTDLPPNSIPATIIIDQDYRVAGVFLKPLLAKDIQPLLERLVAE